MSDIQRWDFWIGLEEVQPDDNGRYVLLADHVAALAAQATAHVNALAALTQERDFLQQQVDDQATAHEAALAVAYPRHACEECRAFERGVQAARDAVAALMPDTADEGVVLNALAAIDRLRGDESWQAKATRESVPVPVHEAQPVPYGPLICSECGKTVIKWFGAWTHNDMAVDDHAPAIDALRGES